MTSRSGRQAEGPYAGRCRNDVCVAARLCLQIGDASMVLSLERVRRYEDRNLLAAHIMVLLEKDYNQVGLMGGRHRRAAREGGAAHSGGRARSMGQG